MEAALGERVQFYRLLNGGKPYRERVKPRVGARAEVGRADPVEWDAAESPSRQFESLCGGEYLTQNIERRTDAGIIESWRGVLLFRRASLRACVAGRCAVLECGTLVDSVQRPSCRAAPPQPPPPFLSHRA